MREHGTRAKYVIDKCRCDDCTRASTEAQREARNRIEPPYVNATPVRKHVRWLMDQGVGLKTIAKASKVAHGTISKLIYGDPQRGMAPSKRVRPATAEKLMAVTPADGAGGSRVPAAPTLKTVDELLARGWTKVAIARAIGQRGPGLQLGTEMVTRAHAATIKALLDEPVPPRRSRHGLHPVPQPVEEVQEPELNDADRFVLQMAELLEERIDRREWHALAACRGRPAWMFFPARGDMRTIKAALKVCGACLVREQCREAHMHDREGIAGGLTVRQRRRRLRTTTITEEAS